MRHAVLLLCISVVGGCDPTTPAERGQREAPQEAELARRLASAEDRIRQLEKTPTPQPAATPGGLADAVVEILDVSAEPEVNRAGLVEWSWTVTLKNRSNAYGGGSIVIFFHDAFQNVLASDIEGPYFLTPFEVETYKGTVAVSSTLAPYMKRVSAELRPTKPSNP